MALAGSLSLYELGAEAYRSLVIRERSKRLPTYFLNSIPDHSIGSGSFPDKNRTAEGFDVASRLNTYPNYFGYFLKDPDRQEWILDEIAVSIENGIIPVVKTGYPQGLTKNRDLFFNMLGKIIDTLENYDHPYILAPFDEMPAFWAKELWDMVNIDPQEFVAGWHEMYKYICDRSLAKHPGRDARNANVAFSVNSSIYIDPLNPEPYKDWLPKDSLDIFALDIFDKSEDNPLRSEHYIFPPFSPEIVIGPDIAHMNSLAPHIPKVVLEINYLQTRGKAEWLRRAVFYLKMLGVKFWMSFDWDKSGFGETKWNPRHYQDLMDTYTLEFAEPHYISSDQSLRGDPYAAIERLYTA